ncbi:MAG: DUF1311 domain-containing protein [Bacteroides sp.]|nr:DUF1311 domain-containing protein [Bacteroides sp.]
MKKLQLFSILLFCLTSYIPAYGQNETAELTFEEVIAICETEARQRVEEFIQEKIRFHRWDPEYDALKIEFTSDTLFIESVELCLSEKGRDNMLEMKFTAAYKEEKYDQLLNKYYRIVRDRLTPEHQQLFLNAQRTWLRYRDSEEEINKQLITSGTYTGGGTMWPLVSALRSVQMIKQRVVYFYELLDCI